MDLNLFHWINEFAGRYDWLDKFALFFADPAIYVLGALVALLWFMDEGTQRVKNQYAVIMAAQALFLCRGILTEFIRQVFPRPRPFVENAVNLLVEHNALDAGFPSAHAVAAFAIAIPVFIYNRKAGTWLLLIAFLISLSRVFIGVHYPSDILAAFVLSLLVVLFLNFYREVFIVPFVRIFSRNSED